jgi:DNA-binding response OmpR family regulator
MTILILEDDVALCKGIELALAAPDRRFALCHDVGAARTALDGCSAARSASGCDSPARAASGDSSAANAAPCDSSPALFILDVNLPDGSGLDFCVELRAAGYDSPILMLTANDTELDMVTGLERGADDYVTKPFSLAVFRARVDALLRRGRGSRGGKASAGDFGFNFDFENMRFEKNGRQVELSKTEARLLRILYANKGQTMPRERLLELIWRDGAEYVDENALSVAIRRLRAKLEDEPSKPRFIKTVHGIGYRWAVSL